MGTQDRLKALQVYDDLFHALWRTKNLCQRLGIKESSNPFVTLRRIKKFVEG